MKAPIPVLSLPPFDQWDQSLLRDLLGGHLTPPGCEFVHYKGAFATTYADTAVILIPGRYDGAEAGLATVVEQIGAALVIVTGDEESTFDWRAIDHPKLRWWFMTPDPAKEYPAGARFLGSGYPPWLRDELRKAPEGRFWDWSYAGQVNHRRRSELTDTLEDVDQFGLLAPSAGFTKGLPHDEYARLLATTKVVPAPSGKYTPDSFRLHEALEAGCVPIADGATPAGPQPDYWPMVFPQAVPFQVLEGQWTSVGKYLSEALDGWQAKANRCFAWWQLHKRTMGTWLADDLAWLGIRGGHSWLTVLIPTSPIEGHPSTEILEETIASVRFHHPDAEIILMIDGVRPEQEHLRSRYEEYVARVLWRCNFEWQRIVPLRFDEHTHQAAMTRRALELVRTPQVLFVEHDTPLVTDWPIDWWELRVLVGRGHLNVVRLFHEAVRQADHRHLELDDEPVEFGDGWLDPDSVPIVRTMQWSQRPHLASTAFYRDLIDRHFTEGARTMIEDVVHGKAEEAWRRDGEMAWHQWRIGIYAPEGNYKRSYHLDGRGEASKFEGSFVA